MTDAEPTPPAQDRVGASLLRTLAGGVAVIVLVTGAFWGIGQLTDDGGTPVVSGDDGGTAASDDDDAGPDGPTDEPDAEGGAHSPSADGGTVPDDQDGATDGDEPDATDGADADDGGDGADAGDDAVGADDADGDASDPDVDRAIAPDGVSLQVLDGVKTDGGTAADGVASTLEGAGYRIVARNDALDYEVTTVLYNPGQEDAARQVAAELGGAEVRAQPGNLSSEVDLHVVVGRDRA